MLNYLPEHHWEQTPTRKPLMIKTFFRFPFCITDSDYIFIFRKLPSNIYIDIYIPNILFLKI